VIGGLHQADPCDAPIARSPEHVLHQPPAGGDILCAGIDRDRTNAGDRIALPQEVAADDASCHFRHDGIDVLAPEQMRHQPDRRGRIREIGWEGVLIGNRAKRLVTDHAAPVGIVRRACAKGDGDLVGGERGHGRSVTSLNHGVHPFLLAAQLPDAPMNGPAVLGDVRTSPPD
jgi:hypothetical protein